jgi:hypothetical protein
MDFFKTLAEIDFKSGSYNCISLIEYMGLLCFGQTTILQKEAFGIKIDNDHSYVEENQNKYHRLLNMYFTIEQNMIDKYPELEGIIFRLYITTVELNERIA